MIFSFLSALVKLLPYYYIETRQSLKDCRKHGHQNFGSSNKVNEVGDGIR